MGGLQPEFLKMNPNGKIPVISDKGNIVWESHTILRYLAAQYGAEKFWPTTPIQRSKIECWMDWQQTALQPDFLTGVFLGYYRTPEKERNWAAINTSIKKTNQHLNLLNTILKNNDFLVGNDFSLADVTVGTTLYRYFELDLEKPTLSYVEKWYQRLKARPAYQQHVMIPFHDTKEQRSF